MVDRGAWEFTSKFLCDTGKERVRRLKSASGVEEIIVDPDGWPLQNTLPKFGLASLDHGWDALITPTMIIA